MACGLCLGHTPCPLSGLAGPQPWQQAGTDIKPAACGLCLAPAFLSSRRFPTSGYLHQRQRQRRRGSHRGSICCQVWRKNLRRPDAGLVGDVLNYMACSDPAWSGLVQSDPVCGLSDAWPVQLRRYEMAGGCRRRVRPEGLAYRIAAWQGAASAGPTGRTVSPLEAGWASTSGYGIASRCVVNVVGGRRRVGVCGWRVVFVGLYGCVFLWGCMGVCFCGAVWARNLRSVYGCGICGVCLCVYLWCVVVVVGGLVCVAGWARIFVEPERWSRRKRGRYGVGVSVQLVHKF